MAKVMIFFWKIISKNSAIFDLDSVYPADVKRILTNDEYVGRYFLHCTDIPGDHLKNTEEMIIRSLKFRKKQEVLGDVETKSIIVKVIRVLTFLLYFIQMFGQKIWKKVWRRKGHCTYGTEMPMARNFLFLMSRSTPKVSTTWLTCRGCFCTFLNELTEKILMEWLP